MTDSAVEKRYASIELAREKKTRELLFHLQLVLSAWLQGNGELNVNATYTGPNKRHRLITISGRFQFGSKIFHRTIQEWIYPENTFWIIPVDYIPYGNDFAGIDFEMAKKDSIGSVGYGDYLHNLVVELQERAVFLANLPDQYKDNVENIPPNLSIPIQKSRYTPRIPKEKKGGGKGGRV